MTYLPDNNEFNAKGTLKFKERPNKQEFFSKKILHLVDTLASGGSERQLFELVRALNPEKYQPVVGVMEQGGFYAEKLREINIPLYDLPRLKRLNLKTLRKIISRINTENFALIHSWGFASTVLGAIASKKLGIPLLNGSLRGGHKKTHYWYWGLRVLPRFSDKVIGNSNAALEHFGLDAGIKNCGVIYNGFDLNRCSLDDDGAELKTALGLNKFERIVTKIARIYWPKDYFTFLKAAKATLERFPNTCFLILGDGDKTLENRLKKLHETLKLGSNVRFLGFRADVEKILQISDIFVHCGLKGTREGMPNAIMEAMAMRKPVVATDNGGVRELVADDETGYIVEPENVEAICAKIRFLLKKPELARKLGENGRARIESEFSLEKMVLSWQNVYSELINETTLTVTK